MSLLLGTMIFDGAVSIQIEDYDGNNCWRVLVMSLNEKVEKNIFLTKTELLTLISDLIKSPVIDKVHPKLRCMIKGV